MSDSTIATLRRSLAYDPSDMLVIDQLESQLKRVGEDPSEVFALRRAALESALDAASTRRAEAEGAIEQATQQATEELHELNGTPWVCARCQGRGLVEIPRHQQRWGDGDDWRLNDPVACSACRSERMHSAVRMVRKYDREISAEGVRCMEQRNPELVEELTAALAAEEQAKAELTPYFVASAFCKGAEVAYTNSRARAKFAEPKYGEPSTRVGQKVPVGTRGFVFWIGPEQQVRSQYGTWTYGTVQKIGLRTAEGDVFFTDVKNLDTTVLNAYARLNGVDPETQRREAKEAHERKVLEADRQATLTVFGVQGPRKGQTVRLNGVEGKIFWTGRQKGRMRIGIRARGSVRTDAPTWGFAADAELI